MLYDTLFEKCVDLICDYLYNNKKWIYLYFKFYRCFPPPDGFFADPPPDGGL